MIRDTHNDKRLETTDTINFSKNMEKLCKLKMSLEWCAQKKKDNKIHRNDAVSFIGTDGFEKKWTDFQSPEYQWKTTREKDVHQTYLNLVKPYIDWAQIKTSSLKQRKDMLDQIIQYDNEHINREKYKKLFGKTPLGKKKGKLFEKLSKKIWSREIMSYWFTELLWSYDVEKNANIMDFILVYAGENFLAAAPWSVWDLENSWWVFQFLLKTINDVWTFYSKNKLLTKKDWSLWKWDNKNPRFPWFRWQNHLAHRFSIKNIFLAINKLNAVQTKKLDKLSDQDKITETLNVLIALMHNNPADGIHSLKTYLNDPKVKHMWDKTYSDIQKQYAKKTKVNRSLPPWRTAQIVFVATQSDTKKEEFSCKVKLNNQFKHEKKEWWDYYAVVELNLGKLNWLKIYRGSGGKHFTVEYHKNGELDTTLIKKIPNNGEEDFNKQVSGFVKKIVDAKNPDKYIKAKGIYKTMYMQQSRKQNKPKLTAKL